MFNYFLGKSYIFYEEIDEPYSFADTVVGTCVETKEKNHLGFTKRYDGLTASLKNSKQALPGFIERNMTDDELDELSETDPNMRDIDKNDIKEVADLLKMPSKKIH